MKVEETEVKMFDIERQDDFFKIWKRVRKNDGHMALCNVSEHEKQILKVTMVDSLWPICASREEAIRVVKKSSGEGR